MAVPSCHSISEKDPKHASSLELYVLERGNIQMEPGCYSGQPEVQTIRV